VSLRSSKEFTEACRRLAGDPAFRAIYAALAKEADKALVALLSAPYQEVESLRGEARAYKQLVDAIAEASGLR
jgi:hypothetical protein